MFREILNFIIHLRLHYQFLILSGGFLLGGFMAGQMNMVEYWLQFLNVHILLYGGATVYNSWWDKDTGPVGGLKNPPVMSNWMHLASFILMYAGLIAAFFTGLIFTAIYLVSFLLFWLYSTPRSRWKGRPWLSMVAIGISTGFNSVLLGTLAAGGEISLQIMLSATGAALILLSLYPVSQIYQLQEDQKRNDRTFAVSYGIEGVRQFFRVSFTSGILILCAAMYMHLPWAGLGLFVGSVFSGIFLAQIIMKLKGKENEYSYVMKSKFLASLSFVIFFLFANAIQYGWIGS